MYCRASRLHRSCTDPSWAGAKLVRWILLRGVFLLLFPSLPFLHLQTNWPWLKFAQLIWKWNKGKYFSVYSIFWFTTFLTLTRSLVEFPCWSCPPHSLHGELHANLSGGSGDLCGVLPSCGTSSPLFFLSGGSRQPSAPSSSVRPLIVTTSWNLYGVIQIINYKK